MDYAIWNPYVRAETNKLGVLLRRHPRRCAGEKNESHSSMLSMQNNNRVLPLPPLPKQKRDFLASIPNKILRMPSDQTFAILPRNENTESQSYPPTMSNCSQATTFPRATPHHQFAPKHPLWSLASALPNPRSTLGADIHNAQPHCRAKQPRHCRPAACGRHHTPFHQ